MSIKRFDIWIADLNPRVGAETGKTRPLLVIQTNLLNNIRPSTIICPITTNVQTESEILRVHLKKGMAKLKEDCDIIIDQLRAFDNKRFLKKIGEIPLSVQEKVEENLKIVLDIE